VRRNAQPFREQYAHYELPHEWLPQLKGGGESCKSFWGSSSSSSCVSFQTHTHTHTQEDAHAHAYAHAHGETYRELHNSLRYHHATLSDFFSHLGVCVCVCLCLCLCLSEEGGGGHLLIQLN
jgi:hypothetical protein